MISRNLFYYQVRWSSSMLFNVNETNKYMIDVFLFFVNKILLLVLFYELSLKSNSNQNKFLKNKEFILIFIAFPKQILSKNVYSTHNKHVIKMNLYLVRYWSKYRVKKTKYAGWWIKREFVSWSLLRNKKWI